MSEIEISDKERKREGVRDKLTAQMMHCESITYCFWFAATLAVCKSLGAKKMSPHNILLYGDIFPATRLRAAGPMQLKPVNGTPTTDLKICRLSERTRKARWKEGRRRAMHVCLRVRMRAGVPFSHALPSSTQPSNQPNFPPLLRQTTSERSVSPKKVDRARREKGVWKFR